MQVEIKCLHCGGCHFDVQSLGRAPKAGDQIKCLDCGGLNDFMQMQKVAVEAAMSEYVKNNRSSIISSAKPLSDPEEIKQAQDLKKQAQS